MAVMNKIPNILLSAFFCLSIPPVAVSAEGEQAGLTETEAISRFETEMARGNETAALANLLDYTIQEHGENSPQAVKLTRRYGHALYEDFRYREATEVLKTALERSTAAFGPAGGEAFEINMNIGYAYSKWSPRLSYRLEYFDRALEILRERGEHESLEYVNTLVSIIVNLMQNNGLSGSYTSHLSDTLQSPEVDEYAFPIEYEYDNHFGTSERYIDEAVELCETLRQQDDYICAKVAIVQAQLKVRETVDLAAVPMGVGGYISGGTANEYYDEEEERLTMAVEKLAENPELNRSYLHAANKALMEIAWLDKDKERMLAMCSGGVLNSASEYPPDRLYEVSENGMVFAPEIGSGVNMNLFKPRAKRKVKKDKNGNPIKRPYFVPVCVDGRLMAALVNAPVVTVEEL